MPGKKKTPDQSAQAVILREAGYSLSAIASRLDISVSTAQRILKTNKVVAGTSTQALIERAREEMLNTAFALEEVQRIAAASVLDDLALTQQIRLKLSSAVEQLDPADPGVFRGLAASATTLKLTQDCWRRRRIDPVAETSLTQSDSSRIIDCADLCRFGDGSVLPRHVGQFGVGAHSPIYLPLPRHLACVLSSQQGRMSHEALSDHCRGQDHRRRRL